MCRYNTHHGYSVYRVLHLSCNTGHKNHRTCSSSSSMLRTCTVVFVACGFWPSVHVYCRLIADRAWALASSQVVGHTLSVLALCTIFINQPLDMPTSGQSTCKSQYTVVNSHVAKPTDTSHRYADECNSC